jgi:hypothetical protein
MDSRKSSLERAFELARSGSCPTVDILIRTLNSEGYMGSQVTGKMLRKQLTQLIRTSTAGQDSR